MASAEAVAAVVEAGGAHVPGLMRELEERLATVARLARRDARRARVRDDRRGRQAAAAAAGLRRRGAGRGRARCGAARGGRGRARALGDAGPRRRARRGGAAARPADGGGLRRALDRDGDRRPAVLARVRGAGGRRRRSSRCGCSRTPRRRSSRASCCSARTRGSCRRRASATCAAAISRPRGCSARRASWARWPAAATSPLLGEFGERIGLAFQLLDDVLDVSRPGRADRQAPRHRPARRHGHAAADPRARARPGAGALDLRAVRTPEQAEGVCDAIAATGALEAAREEALAMVAEAKADLPALPEPSQQAALELVADGVVDRYPARSPRGGSRWRRARRRSARPRPPCSPGRCGAGP